MYHILTVQWVAIVKNYKKDAMTASIEFMVHWLLLRMSSSRKLKVIVMASPKNSRTKLGSGVSGKKYCRK